MGLRDVLAKVVKRADDWWSAATGLGGTADRVRGLEFRYNSLLSDGVLDALCAGDPLARRVVELPVVDANREGFRIAIAAEGLDGDGDRSSRRKAQAKRRQEAAGLGEELIQYQDERRIWSKYLEGRKLGRQFGGAIGIIGADDGREMFEPLADQAIRTVLYLDVVDRRYVQVMSRVRDDRSPRFGEPEMLYISNDKPVMMTMPVREVHASRCVFFPGLHTTKTIAAYRLGWDLSVLDLIWLGLQNYQSAWGSVNAALSDWSQGVLKIKDLANLVADGQKQVLKDRVEMMEAGASVARSKVLDLEESYEVVTRQFTSIPDVLERIEAFVATCVGWPQTKLTGREPAGMNATGESDDRTWDNVLKQEWVETDYPLHRQLCRITMLAKDSPTRGKLPGKWKVIANPFRQPTPKERADLQASGAAAAETYINLGVLTKEAVLRAQFRQEGYTAELDVDADAILDEQEEGEEQQKTAVSVPGVENQAATALNGAQVTSLLEVVRAAAAKEIPRETAVRVVVLAFPVDETQAEALVPGDDFEPPPKQLPPNPFGGPPKGLPGKGETEEPDQDEPEQGEDEPDEPVDDGRAERAAKLAERLRAKRAA